MRRNVKDVEWLDEHLTGHSTAYREHGKVYVEVRCGGSVLLNGKEYILDEVVTLPVEPCTIPPEQPS